MDGFRLKIIKHTKYTTIQDALTQNVAATVNDDAGKPILDDSTPCLCGHSYDWHDKDESCRFETCGCTRFNEDEEDFDDTDRDE